MESSQTEDWTHVPCTGRQILNHWTTREVLLPFLPPPQTHSHRWKWFFRTVNQMSIPIFSFALGKKKVLCVVSRVPQLLPSAHSGLLLCLWHSLFFLLLSSLCTPSGHGFSATSSKTPGTTQFPAVSKIRSAWFLGQGFFLPQGQHLATAGFPKAEDLWYLHLPWKKGYPSIFVCCSLGQKPSMDPPRLMQGSPYIWFQTIIHSVNAYWQPTVCQRLTSKSHMKKI